MIRLSILIPTIKRDEIFYHQLLKKLYAQTFGLGTVDVLTESSEKDSIGTKRNKLLERATGGHLCFIDADDDISDDYIKLLLEGIDKGVDCCSLMGMYSVDGVNDGLFEHSIKYDKWVTVGDAAIKYLRYPNHLNCIKSSIAKQFKFPEINHGEDENWSTQIHKSGLIKTEHYIPEVIYYYKKVTR